MSRASWRIVSASEVGTSHLSSGTPCQDAAEHCILRTPEGPVLVVVVCDGAGSAMHSEIGAWLASTTFAELVDVHFDNGGRLIDIDKDKVVEWISIVSERLTERAGQDKNSPKDYSCTLLAAIVGAENAVFAQIGDGAIVVNNGEADGWTWVFWPQHGEYANQTTFILSDGVADALAFDLAPRRVNEFAVFSDGIERMVLDSATKSVNDAFFEHMFGAVRSSKAKGFDPALSDQLKGYLGSQPVNVRTNDDKTLVLATRYRVARTHV